MEKKMTSAKNTESVSCGFVLAWGEFKRGVRTYSRGESVLKGVTRPHNRRLVGLAVVLLEAATIAPSEMGPEDPILRTP